MKLNKTKLKHFAFTILFLLMVVLIYLVAPKITCSIQNLAKWLYELDGQYITRVVELVLTITFVGAVAKVLGGK